MIETSSRNKSLYLDIFTFCAFFIIIGLAFPFSSPESYYLTIGNSEYVFNRYLYFSIVIFALFILYYRFIFSEIKFSSLIYWVLYSFVVVLAMLVSGHHRLNMGILYLLFFVSPPVIQLHKGPILMAAAAAISLNALYGVAGAVAAMIGLSYDVFPIVPYIYDGDVRLDPGFYQAFSPALFLQTNAAGAIFGTAFCLFLYQLISERPRGKLLPLVTLLCLIGLVFTRSLSALLIVGLLSLVVIRGRARALLLIGFFVCAILIFFSPGGVLGVNAEYLQHKIDSSAFVKISLLSENLRQMMGDGILALVTPGREPPSGTENSFIDMAYQFGLLQLLLFYVWCILSLRIFEDRYRALLLFPILLSFIQNSAFTTPSVVIFGVALAIYGNKANPSGKAEDETSLSPDTAARS